MTADQLPSMLARFTQPLETLHYCGTFSLFESGKVFAVHGTKLNYLGIDTFLDSLQMLLQVL